MLDILRLQQRHGLQVLAIGDPKQNQAIEAPAIELLRQALGPDKVPEILTTVRQQTERERIIAGLFREGQAGQAIAMKREDETAILVPGGRDATIERIAGLWRERMEARGSEPGFRLSISVPTIRWNKANKARYVELVRAGAAEMSASLGALSRS